MHKKTIIFDFDGTIADSLHLLVELYNNVAHIFFCKKIKNEDIKKLQSRRPQELMKSYWINTFKLLLLLLRLRRDLKKNIKKLKAIEWIIQAIKDIKSNWFDLGIMTSNSKENVEIFLSMNWIDGVFDFVYSGKNLFGKEKVINKLLKKENICHDKVVYIWDETRDIEAARKIWIPIVSVSWWFNSRDILENLNPNMIVDKPENLLACLRNI